ncbi:NAM domain-containing protein [Cephalotus follicularis]|uniref:NAM domain-containing protein n=1 Tax=Cephalotus follicularis TaxID=3775 RepID=A0A1Q3CEN5_CEPFO|nr:NAM domain-containing protein [Cephalotus follicularis]
MARAFVIDGRSIARKVTCANRSTANEIKDWGAHLECPQCQHRIDNSDAAQEWPGFPAGVKFDPSDAELVIHLAAKCGVGDFKPHMFIDEFIPTLEEDRGINYTHPQNLPGATKDGSSIHFFHKIINAYSTGHRKRRKIDASYCSNEEHVRWHKTGKTKPLTVNGVLMGYKKIMVLYHSSQKSNPKKSNWVMHQYHLGRREDEKEGEYVVSKILYRQPKQSGRIDESRITEDPYSSAAWTSSSPKTPMTNQLINTDRSETPDTCNVGAGKYITPSSAQLEDDMGYSAAWLSGESQADDCYELTFLHDSFLTNKDVRSSAHLSTSGLNDISCTGFARNTAECSDNITSSAHFPCIGFADKTNEVTGNGSASPGISVLENLELDSPPEFQQNLQFWSQDSFFGAFENNDAKASQ